MSYNVTEYITGCGFNGLHDGEKAADLLQTVFVRSTNEAFKRTNIHLHIHTRAYGHSDECTRQKTMRYISYKNQAIG